MVQKSHLAHSEFELLKRYKKEFKISKSPSWAFPSQDWDYSKTPLKKPFPPSIPFIGNNYYQAPKKIALYASAENLAHYGRKPETVPEFLCDERAWNRHREANLEGWDKFFPRLHIGPVENGSLLCAVHFICNHLNLSVPDDPRLFLENLVVGNVGKFSIAGDRSKKKDTNHDYAGSINYLEASLPFFKMDLKVLQPEILILPKSMYTHQEVKNSISEILPEVTIIPVPQFNSTVVNIHLKRNQKTGFQLTKKWKGTILDEWTNHLTGYASGFPYRYYAELESVISEIKNPENRT
jgi:hypothetical protein